jgi:hypothetical protein
MNCDSPSQQGDKEALHHNASNRGDRPPLEETKMLRGSPTMAKKSVCFFQKSKWVVEHSQWPDLNWVFDLGDDIWELDLNWVFV